MSIEIIYAKECNYMDVPNPMDLDSHISLLKLSPESVDDCKYKFICEDMNMRQLLSESYIEIYDGDEVYDSNYIYSLIKSFSLSFNGIVAVSSPEFRPSVFHNLKTEQLEFANKTRIYLSSLTPFIEQFKMPVHGFAIELNIELKLANRDADVKLVMSRLIGPAQQHDPFPYMLPVVTTYEYNNEEDNVVNAANIKKIALINEGCEIEHDGIYLDDVKQDEKKKEICRIYQNVPDICHLINVVKIDNQNLSHKLTIKNCKHEHLYVHVLHMKDFILSMTDEESSLILK